jgi:hypothetical protein
MRHLQATRESVLKLESSMKVKKVALAAAVCAALMSTLGVAAEDQPFPAEGMGFAFDTSEISRVSELSGDEMDETEGANGSSLGPPAPGLLDAINQGEMIYAQYYMYGPGAVSELVGWLTDG